MTDPRFTWDRSRYSARYLSTDISESMLQGAILRALAQAGIAAFAFDSGGKAMRPRAGAGGASAGAAGLPDIIGWLPGGKALFIEVKRPALLEPRGYFQAQGKPQRVIKPAGKLTDSQRMFLTIASADGCAAGVAWSLSDALEIAEVR